MKRLLQKTMLLVTLPAFLFLQSCGSEDKNKVANKESTTDTTMLTEAPTTEAAASTTLAPPAPALPAIPIFRLTRQQLIDINTNYPNTKKLILQTGFANMNDPTTIKLYYYHTDNHKNYARNQIPLAMGMDVPAGTVSGLADEFIFGNCEVNYKELKKELMTGSTWNNFSHLRFTPAIKTINGKGYFSYDIALVDEAGGIVMKAIPVDTKPSPPAPPDPED